MRKALFFLSAAMALVSCTRTNPFLEEWKTPYGIPPFEKIRFEDYIPAVKAGIEAQRAELDAIIASTEAPSFESVIAPFDRSGGLLSKVVGVLYNVSETENCPEMEAIIEEATPLLSAHEDGIYMDKALYGKVAAVYNNKVYDSCMAAAQAAVNGQTNVGTATHFRRAGNHEGIVIGGNVFW